MKLQVIQMLCPTNKYSIKCPYQMSPDYITIHNTASDASAKAEISYMITNNKQVSYHFAVDDIQAVQGLPLDRNGWHAGDGNGKGNRDSIGIEICYSKSGGDRFHKAEDNAAYLTAYLLKERGWGIDRIRKHQDWSGKYCPHRTLDKGWERWLDKVRTILNTPDRTIKGICQLPTQDGFLLGMETYENHNYLYEIQIYDCTKQAWIAGTGKCNVPETSLWWLWQPEYGYYWTLFRVYDANGNILDEECYGFENV